MLRLKRKLGQQVLVDVLTLTVADLTSTDAVLLVDGDARHDAIHIRTGEEREIKCNGGAVRVCLTGVERGEALLAFDAPRSIPIERAERLTRSREAAQSL